MRSSVRTAVFPLILFFAWAIAPAQQSQSEPSDASGTTEVSAAEPEPQLGRRNRPPEKSAQEIEMERKQAKALNKERHEDLKKDTDKLLELAQQLKEHVDKTNENMLSLDVIKKAEEIEKLAKRVREKMRGYWGPAVER